MIGRATEAHQRTDGKAINDGRNEIRLDKEFQGRHKKNNREEEANGVNLRLVTFTRSQESAKVHGSYCCKEGGP